MSTSTHSRSLLSTTTHDKGRDVLVTSRQACELARVTYRQLDHWARLRIVEPSVDARGSGTHRLWSTHDVALVAVLGRLSQLGLELHVCAEAIEALRELPIAWFPDELHVELSDVVHLVVDVRACVPELSEL